MYKKKKNMYKKKNKKKFDVNEGKIRVDNG
jgi:hypothetical protein